MTIQLIYIWSPTVRWTHRLSTWMYQTTTGSIPPAHEAFWNVRFPSVEAVRLRFRTFVARRGGPRLHELHAFFRMAMSYHIKLLHGIRNANLTHEWCIEPRKLLPHTSMHLKNNKNLFDFFLENYELSLHQKSPLKGKTKKGGAPTKKNDRSSKNTMKSIQKRRSVHHF